MLICVYGGKKLYSPNPRSHLAFGIVSAALYGVKFFVNNHLLYRTWGLQGVLYYYSIGGGRLEGMFSQPGVWELGSIALFSYLDQHEQITLAVQEFIKTFPGVLLQSPGYDFSISLRILDSDNKLIWYTAIFLEFLWQHQLTIFCAVLVFPDKNFFQIDQFVCFWNWMHFCILEKMKVLLSWNN